MILVSPAATEPRLPERGLRYTFRTCGRDDLQGSMVGDRIAEEWLGAEIAHRRRRSRVRARGCRGSETSARRTRYPDRIVRGRFRRDRRHFPSLSRCPKARGIDIVFSGSYTAEAGLIARHCQVRLPDLVFIMPDGVASGKFALIASDAAEGIPMTMYMDAVRHPTAREIVASAQGCGKEPLGPELYAYAAVQAWAQAVEKVGMTDPARVAHALHQQQFDTVLGRIGFDDKGDVSGFAPFAWYVWTDGKYVPKDLTD